MNESKGWGNSSVSPSGVTRLSLSLRVLTSTENRSISFSLADASLTDTAVPHSCTVQLRFATHTSCYGYSQRRSDSSEIHCTS